MKFLHINESSNIGKMSKEIRELKNGIETGKYIFMLIYMEGCGPCNMVRPEWKKLENIFKNIHKNVIIVDIDEGILAKAKINIQPKGFPTIMYIHGKENEEFENSDIPNKKREIDSFVYWINSTMQKIQKGGKKWSLKYKRSINCKRVRGFSQRQYCKYGRNKSVKKR